MVPCLSDLKARGYGSWPEAGQRERERERIKGCTVGEVTYLKAMELK